MERINQILYNTAYKEYLKRIEKAERGRIFCGHDLQHFLDVCRLAWILFLEDEKYQREKPQLTREWIYAAGLLHDIGRWQQYEEGVAHEVASSRLAPAILKECGFAQEEIKIIVEAIGNHRNKEIREDNSLSGLLYRADKMSRSCFGCKANKLCDWSTEKKNLKLIY